MNISENLQNSFKILRQNKIRSFLTMLGIIIGITGVIVIISVGNGAQSLILNQIKSVGSNLVAVFPGSGEKDGPPVSVMGIVITTLKYDDIKALKDPNRSPNVKSFSAYVRGSETVTWRENKTDTTFIGVTYSLPEVEDTEVMQGNFFTEEDEKSIQKVAVLGADVYKNLFGNQEAIGELVKIGKHNFRIIGIMERRGNTSFTNQDNQIYVPVTTAQKLLLGINYISFARLKIDNEDKIDYAIKDMAQIIRERHNLNFNEPDDFDIRSQEDSLDVLLKITNAIKFFLTAIAAIALLVGGIGIMNIMLVSVQERIREIGLRKAVGAKNINIMSQFLIETIFITSLSGAIGIVLGIIVSFLISILVNYLGYEWEMTISLNSIILGLFVSSGIGFIFGLVPARRASKLNPIVALQYE